MFFANSSSDAMGAADKGQTNSGPMMADWAGAFPLANGEDQSTVCEGELASAVDAKNDQVYCDANIVPKEFTEEYSMSGR